jgi:hypothetical protein
MIVALVTGVISGSLVGGALGLWISRRPPARATSPEDLRLDADLDEQITAASREWAAAQARPEAAGLMAKKVRLLYVLNRRRQARRGPSW